MNAAETTHFIASTIRDNAMVDATNLLTEAFKAFTPAQEKALIASIEACLPLLGFDTRMILEVAAGDLLEWVGDRMDALERKYQTTGPAWRRHALRCDHFCKVVHLLTSKGKAA